MAGYDAVHPVPKHCRAVQLTSPDIRICQKSDFPACVTVRFLRPVCTTFIQAETGSQFNPETRQITLLIKYRREERPS